MGYSDKEKNMDLVIWLMRIWTQWNASLFVMS